MATGDKLDSSPSATPHHSRPHDQTVQHYSPDTLNWHCIYQASFGYGQTLQPQGSSHSLGRRRRSTLCMPCSSSTFTFTPSSRSTPCHRWRRTTIRRCTVHFHRHRITPEQNLSTIQIDLQVPPYDMDYKEFTPIPTTCPHR